MNLQEYDAIFLDPARRTAGHNGTRRLTSASEYSPSLEFAFGLADRLPVGVKLGPGLDRGLIPDSAEAQWICVDGQVVETGLWFGSLARPGVKRAALVLNSRGLNNSGAAELTAAFDSADAETGPLGQYLYEPNGAVIRARLIGDLARSLQARMVSDSIAYLTSDSPADSPWAASYRVDEVLPFNLKKLKAMLRARGVGRVVVKKRGSPIEPETLARQLRGEGTGTATVVVTRVAGAPTALVCDVS